MKKTIIFLIFTICFVSFSYAQKDIRGALKSGIIHPKDNGFKTGFNFKGTILFGIIDNVDLTITSGLIKWNQRDLPQNKFKIIPLYLGSRYYFHNGIISPYLGAELGINLIEYDKTIELGISKGKIESFENAGFFSKNFGYGFTVGFIASLNNNLQLDINSKFNYVNFHFSPTVFNSLNLDSDPIQYFSFINVGLIFKI